MVKIPEKIKYLLTQLNDSGYESYIVGGCVRDSFLGIEPKDWDITTDATPDEIREVFKELSFVNNNGEKHGTVTVRYEKENFEITTFRTDGEYQDHRHPDNVEFTKSLEEDLKRRDFTINAMAINEHYVIQMPNGHNSMNDLENKIIKAVGNPIERFREDALRILRMIRFASVLDFHIDSDTLDAGWTLRENLKFISKERIREEINKFLCGKGFKRLALNYQVIDILKVIFPHIGNMLHFDQRSRYHKHDLWLHTVNVVNNIENKDYITAMAAFLHDIGKVKCNQEYIHEDGRKLLHFIGHPEVSYEDSLIILKDLKYSNEDIVFISTLIKYHDVDFTGTMKNTKKILNLLGDKSNELYPRLIDLKTSDWKDHDFGQSKIKLPSKETLMNLYNAIIKQQECFSLKDLAINGYDLMDLGIEKGPLMKTILNDCLEKVINEELPNDKKELKEYVKGEI